jgi:hypothetical protein
MWRMLVDLAIVALCAGYLINDKRIEKLERETKENTP